MYGTLGDQKWSKFTTGSSFTFQQINARKYGMCKNSKCFPILLPNFMFNQDTNYFYLPINTTWTMML